MRCLFLFSGGLDSMLGVKVLQEQGIEVDPIAFVGCFFGSEQAEAAAKNFGIKLRIYDFSEEHLAMVKNPPRGYGKNMNPCVDCHLMMIVKAGEIMRAEGYDFIATGEVLGERPMSQNRQMLDFIERKSGLAGKLLRPLSAKLMEPTEMEQSGEIDREKLEDIEGRGRTRQLELVKKFGIKEFPTPAGGCSLTDPGFSKKLRELFEKIPTCTNDDIELLKIGRQLWLGNNKLVIGRNHEENEKIEAIKKEKDCLIKIKNFPGPLGLLHGESIDEKIIGKSAEIVAWYSTKARKEKEVAMQIFSDEEKGILVEPKESDLVG